jgi:hypothetical protein
LNKSELAFKLRKKANPADVVKKIKMQTMKSLTLSLRIDTSPSELKLTIQITPEVIRNWVNHGVVATICALPSSL